MINHSHPQDHIFFAYPFTGALLFQNDDSSCRDNCAAERSTRLLPLLMKNSLIILMKNHSIPLIPTLGNIHGRCINSNCGIFPFQNPAQCIRVTHCQARWNSVLVPRTYFFSRWVWELHQDCQGLCEKAGGGAKWLEDT